MVGVGVIGYWQLRVTTIECWLDTTPSVQKCPDELAALLQPLLAQPLVAFDFETQLASLFDTHRSPYELIQVRKRWPGTLVVELRQDPFQYVLTDRSAQKPWLVTEHGWLRNVDSTPSAELALPRVSRPDFTTIVSEDSRHLTPETHDLITRLIQALQLYDIQYLELILYDPVTTIINLNDHQQVLIENDVVLENLEKLRLLQAHPNQGGNPESIVEYDVRFKLPVLRTQKTLSL